MSDSHSEGDKSDVNLASGGGRVVLTDLIVEDEYATSNASSSASGLGGLRLASAVQYGNYPPCFHSPKTMIAWVFHTIKALVLTVLSLGQRLMCCFKRKKSAGGGGPAGFRGTGLPTSISSSSQVKIYFLNWYVKNFLHRSSCKL